MLNIAILLGSTRPGRNGEPVAHWVKELASRRTDAKFELVDIAEQHLPFLDEPIPPSQGKYTKDHTKAWSARIAAYDGFVFVTAEYNHSVPAAMKNAVDFLYKEWNNKVAGFVSYGSAAGGARAVEHWRAICAELQMSTVRAQVLMTLMDDFEEFRTFKPRPHHEKALGMMLDQLVSWAVAHKAAREAPKPGSHETARPPGPTATPAPHPGPTH